MSQQIQISGGAKVRDLQDVIIGTSGVLSSLAFNVANGVPKLDSNGKILVAQLPNSVMEYLGTWSAATNTPTLANGTGNQGDVYLCNVAGTVDFGAGPIAFFVGDQVIYSGSIWQRASGATGTVTSVAVTESGDSLNITGSPITTSGTINIGFNGTNLQYVNGAGNLTTFPILTGYVTAVSGTAPVVSSGGTTPAISMAAATGLVDGYLLATDFAIFSAKQSALTFSSPLVNTSGTISIPAATTSVNGYLASADFTTFNNKQNAITLTTTGSSGVSTLVGATLNIPDYGSALTGYVPYTGATANVDLGVFDLTADLITGATGSFASSGGSDTFAINHSSGSGIALNITKGGNGEGLYINKTSGSGNAATIVGTLNATTLVKSGGTSSQFLKADGTVDSNTYALDSAVVHNTGNETIGGTKTFSDATKNNGGIFLQNASSNSLAGYMNIGGLTNGVKFTSGGGISNTFTLPSATGYTFTFPSSNGTVALTSDLASYVPYTGATASVDLGAFLLTASGVDSVGYTARGSGTLSGYLILKQGTTFLGNVVGYNSINANARKYVFISDVDGTNYKSAIFELSSLTNNTDRTYTLPDASGTIALVGGSGVGTVTSVAALTIGTSGTDLSSTVANSTTTPVITLNVPTASATNRGALSSADWTTFNNKQSALTNPVTGTGTTNYLPKFTGTSTIGNSLVYDNGSGVTVNGTTVGEKFNVNGFIGLQRSNTQYWHVGVDANNSISFTRSGIAERMVLSSDGNLGLAVTPSAWSSGTRALQVGSYGALAWAGGIDISMTNNAYYDGTNWVYIASQEAGRFLNNRNTFAWYQAAAGTAGNAITFTQAMTLTAAGRLLINKTNEETYQLDVNGTGRFSGQLSVSHSTANNYAAVIYNTSATGEGLTVRGGSTSSHNAFIVQPYNGATTLFNILATGAATFSSGIATLGYTASTSYAALFNGSVGIGTTAPSTDQLVIYSPTAGAGRQLGLDGATGNYAQINFLEAGTTKWRVRKDDNNEFDIYSDGYSGSVIHAKNNGNVGIGTTSPSYLLDVNGTGRFTGPLSGTSASFSSSVTATGNVTARTRLAITKADNTLGASIDYDDSINQCYIYNHKTGGYFSIYTNAVERLQIASTGAATFSSTIQTGTPSGGTAKPWKLGQDTSTLYSATRTIQVEIDGGTYYLLAVKSTDL